MGRRSRHARWISRSACATTSSEETDPSVRGDWGVSLRDAGLTFRDEGYGFLYLGESPG